MKKNVKKKELDKFLMSQHVSRSKYWYFKNENKENKVQNIFFLILKKFKNLIEYVFNISINKKKISIDNYSYKENNSFIIEPEILKKRKKLLSKELTFFLKKLKLKVKNLDVEKIINKHDNFFYKRKIIKNNFGGVGYNNSLILYVFSSIIKPDNVIESGVWKGFTTLIFDQTLKKSKKYCFDINFSKLIYTSDKAEYINFDLNRYNFKDRKIFKSCLAFFDDHVSQYDRLLFCDKNKIPFIVFDDDNDYFTIHSDGWPSIPTISMVKNSFNIKNRFMWKSLNRIGYAKFKNINSSILKNFYYFKAPDLFNYTGYHNGSPMSFLIRR